MDGKNVTELEELTELTDTDNVLVGQSNTLKRVSFANFKAVIKTLIGNATSLVSGLMSARDKANLDTLNTNFGSKTVATTLEDSDDSVPTSKAVETALDSYETKSELTSTLADYSTSDEVDSKIDTKLADYSTSEEIADTYETKTDVQSELKNYIPYQSIKLYGGSTITISSPYTYSQYLLSVCRDGEQYSMVAIVNHRYNEAPDITYLQNAGWRLTVSTEATGIVKIKTSSSMEFNVNIIQFTKNIPVTYSIS